jgi:hypothetical protein
MKTSRGGRVLIASLLATVVFALTPFMICAQDKPKRETIQAQAMGQNKAAGKTINVTISIDSYSTPDDQMSLYLALTQGGQAAVSQSLSKMKSKGWVAVTGTPGYSIAYVRMIPTKDGRRIRLITNHPIELQGAGAGGHPHDDDMSALELNLDKDESKNSGTLIFGLRMKLDKDNKLAFESNGSGPWQLVNVVER